MANVTLSGLTTSPKPASWRPATGQARWDSAAVDSQSRQYEARFPLRTGQLVAVAGNASDLLLTFADPVQTTFMPSPTHAEAGWQAGTPTNPLPTQLDVPIVVLGGGPVVSSVVAADGQVTVTFDRDVTLLIKDGAYWPIAGPTSMAVSAVAQPTSKTVRLTTSRMRNGASYTLSVPLAGVFSAGGYCAASNNVFTGFATMWSAVAVAATYDTIIVNFTADMGPSAFVFSNYGLDGGASVVAASQRSPSSVLLTTSQLRPSTTYNLTLTGITDAQGN